VSDGSAEFRQLANDLGRIAGHAVKDVDEVLKKGAQNVKEEMSDDIRKSRHFVGKKGPWLESSISYDSEYRIGTPRYVIGPDKSRPGGALGNIYYFGTSRGGGTGRHREAAALGRTATYFGARSLAQRWAGQI
jgi:hypothetical protein